jgi:hypothetical protein
MSLAKAKSFDLVLALFLQCFTVKTKCSKAEIQILSYPSSKRNGNRKDSCNQAFGLLYSLSHTINEQPSCLHQQLPNSDLAEQTDKILSWS